MGNESKKNTYMYLVSHSVVSDSVTPWTVAGMDCHSLLQGIFPTQGLNSGLLHCRQTLYHLSHQGRFQRNKHKILLGKKKRRALRGLGRKFAVNRNVETDGHQWPRAALPNRHVHKAPGRSPGLPASQPGATGKRKCTHAFLISFPRISCGSWGSQDIAGREYPKSWPPPLLLPPLSTWYLFLGVMNFILTLVIQIPKMLVPKEPLETTSPGLLSTETRASSIWPGLKV